ncbi:hypothetical protein ACP4OV_027381 [Aristida adscensionis]
MYGNNEQIQFSWGRCRAKGGQKKDILFYESFTFDNVKYSLYDCVYLFKDGDPDPYVGKIMKMWEQNQVKKVKILWFFFPYEIQKYLEGPLMEKEIFLACGDGVGQSDINPLEAIAGKCAVICISKDERNRQPSPREQAMADYVFYRFFNVKSCTLSDELPEKIGGLEVNVLLNPKDEQFTSIPDPEVRGVTHNTDQRLVATVPCPQQVVKKEHERLVSAGPIPHTAIKDKDEHLVAEEPVSQSVIKEEDQNPVAAEPVSQSVIKEEDQNPVAAIPISHSAVRENEKTVASTRQRSKVTENISKHTQNASSGERPPKKLKLSREVKQQNVDQDIPDKKPLELSTRQTDTSKWFKFTWDVRLQNADQQGTLVLIQNLDIQFAAADIEELIREALQLNCIAKPINHPTYDDPNNGKAYAIFKTKDDADIAISKINSGLVVGGRPLYCSKGSLKVPKPAGTLVGHLSVYNIKITQKQREEQKKAVSTSHCSQPNTIEYDLALDWMLVREKQERRFRALHKRHEDDRRGFANLGSKNAKIGK